MAGRHLRQVRPLREDAQRRHLAVRGVGWPAPRAGRLHHDGGHHRVAAAGAAAAELHRRQRVADSAEARIGRQAGVGAHGPASRRHRAGGQRHSHLQRVEQPRRGCDGHRRAGRLRRSLRPRRRLPLSRRAAGAAEGGGRGQSARVRAGWLSHLRPVRCQGQGGRGGSLSAWQHREAGRVERPLLHEGWQGRREQLPLSRQHRLSVHQRRHARQGEGGRRGDHAAGARAAVARGHDAVARSEDHGLQADGTQGLVAHLSGERQGWARGLRHRWIEGDLHLHRCGWQEDHRDLHRRRAQGRRAARCQAEWWR